MSLKTRIEAYTGTLSASATDLLKKSIAKVADLIPSELLVPLATPITTGASGLDITDKKVVAADFNGYAAKEVLKADSARYADASSIYFASTRCPVYFTSGNKVFTLPSAGNAHMLNFGVVTEADSDITCIPKQFEEAVILDVAIAKLSEKAATIGMSSIPAITLDSTYEAVVFPTALQASDWTWTNASVSTVSPTTVASLLTAPTMTDVTATLDAVPADLTALSATLPADFAPTLTVPGTFSLSIKTESGGAVAGTDIVYPAALGSIAVAYTEASDMFGSFLGEVEPDLINLRGQADAVLQVVESNLGGGDEDIELSMARLSSLKATVDTYLANIDVRMKKYMQTSDVSKVNAVQAFQKTVEASRNELNKFSQNIQLFVNHAQVLLNEHKENVELFQVVSTFKINEFRAKLERYQTAAQIDLAKFKANVELWQADQSLTLNKYQADIQKVQADIQAKVSTWNADVQVKMKNAEMALQAAAETAKMTTDANMQNAVQAFQSKVAKYQAQLQTASAQIQKRQLDIQTALQKQQALVQQRLEEYKAISTTIQILQARFISFFAPFQKPKENQ